mgnify:CR=1 FL=1
MAPVGCGDADAIVIALSSFVEVHQQLLGVVIGKVRSFASQGVATIH